MIPPRLPRREVDIHAAMQNGLVEDQSNLEKILEDFNIYGESLRWFILNNDYRDSLPEDGT